jgi:hypothetical protein
MRVEGAKRLSRQLKDLPVEVQAEVAKTIRRNTEAGARLARQLVPVDSGELRGWIFTKYNPDGLTASVEAAPDTADAQKKARAVEFGRQKGNRGTTSPAPYMRIMQSHLGKRFRTSIKRAIKKAAKQAVSGG